MKSHRRLGKKKSQKQVILKQKSWAVYFLCFISGFGIFILFYLYLLLK
jgi:hypothetical protein